MDTCSECQNPLNPGRTIGCSGSCGRGFHHTCVGLNKTQIAAWSSRVGLLWFCASCRLNFDPAMYDREKVIMKALRELLIRMDSMDTRLGSYGENLRKINSTLYTSKPKAVDPVNNQNAFSQSIALLNLDDTVEDPINRSRSCDDTSFFEVLDDINSTIAHQPEKFQLGNNKRVQINPQATSSTTKPAGQLSRQPLRDGTKASQGGGTLKPRGGGSVLQRSGEEPGANGGGSGTNDDPLLPPDEGSGSNDAAASRLKVGVKTKDQPAEDEVAFYVTPFSPDQEEMDIEQHIKEISNCESFQVKVSKLVPRGRSRQDLTFISFKFRCRRKLQSPLATIVTGQKE